MMWQGYLDLRDSLVGDRSWGDVYCSNGQMFNGIIIDDLGGKIQAKYGQLHLFRNCGKYR